MRLGRLLNHRFFSFCGFLRSSGYFNFSNGLDIVPLLMLALGTGNWERAFVGCHSFRESFFPPLLVPRDTPAPLCLEFNRSTGNCPLARPPHQTRIRGRENDFFLNFLLRRPSLLGQRCLIPFRSSHLYDLFEVFPVKNIEILTLPVSVGSVWLPGSFPYWISAVLFGHECLPYGFKSAVIRFYPEVLFFPLVVTFFSHSGGVLYFFLGGRELLNSRKWNVPFQFSWGAKGELRIGDRGVLGCLFFLHYLSKVLSVPQGESKSWNFLDWASTSFEVSPGNPKRDPLLVCGLLLHLETLQRNFYGVLCSFRPCLSFGSGGGPPLRREFRCHPSLPICIPSRVFSVSDGL